jgi:hypothetical protein
MVAPNEIEIVEKRKMGRVDVVFQLPLSVTVIWTPEG